jgi:hypothetical protein
VDTELQHLISGQYNLITLLLVHIGLTWFRFCLEVTSVRLYRYVWFHGRYVRITVIYRDSPKATLFSFCKMTVNRRDSEIFIVIANIGLFFKFAKRKGVRNGFFTYKFGTTRVQARKLRGHK